MDNPHNEILHKATQAGVSMTNLGKMRYKAVDHKNGEKEFEGDDPKELFQKVLRARKLGQGKSN